MTENYLSFVKTAFFVIAVVALIGIFVRFLRFFSDVYLVAYKYDETLRKFVFQEADGFFILKLKKMKNKMVLLKAFSCGLFCGLSVPP